MPAMVVSITNVTDAPESKKTPTRLAIYSVLLDPGDELKLPAPMVDARLRKLEADGYIIIGQLPSWYAASKAKKVGRRTVPLTQEELEKRLTTKKAEAPKEGPTAFAEENGKDLFLSSRKKTYKLDDLKEELKDVKEDTDKK
jgi:hypothetical protein